MLPSSSRRKRKAQPRERRCGSGRQEARRKEPQHQFADHHLSERHSPGRGSRHQQDREELDQRLPERAKGWRTACDVRFVQVRQLKKRAIEPRAGSLGFPLFFCAPAQPLAFAFRNPHTGRSPFPSLHPAGRSWSLLLRSTTTVVYCAIDNLVTTTNKALTGFAEFLEGLGEAKHPGCPGYYAQSSAVLTPRYASLDSGIPSSRRAAAASFFPRTTST